MVIMYGSAVPGDVEPAVDLLHGDSRCKGPKGFPLFDHGVDSVAHLGMTGIGQDAPIAERARAELHVTAIPCDHAPARSGRRLLRKWPRARNSERIRGRKG